MDITEYMLIITTNTMRRNIYIMSTSMKKKINNIHFALLAALLVGCSLSPGMYMSSGNKSAVYIEGLDRNIIIAICTKTFFVTIKFVGIEDPE